MAYVSILVLLKYVLKTFYIGLSNACEEWQLKLWALVSAVFFRNFVFSSYALMYICLFVSNISIMEPMVKNPGSSGTLPSQPMVVQTTPLGTYKILFLYNFYWSGQNSTHSLFLLLPNRIIGVLGSRLFCFFKRLLWSVPFSSTLPNVSQPSAAVCWLSCHVVQGC